MSSLTRPSRVRKPRIAVFVTAFRRKTFLREAVASVLASTLPPEEYELCILTDFALRPVDFPQASTPPIVLTPTGSSAGTWIAEGIRSTRADYLAFLDDDDLFEPDKLARVANSFESEPSLGYLKHGLTRFGGTAGRSSADPTSAGEELTPVLDTDDDKTQHEVERLWEEGASFNSSSIAVARSLVEPLLEDLSRLQGGYATFLFFAALASEKSIRVDPARLSRYRIHPENQSFGPGLARSEYWARALQLAEVRRDDARTTLQFTRSARPGLSTRPLRRAEAKYAILAELASARAHRRRLIESLLELGAASTRKHLWRERAVLAVAVAGLLAPGRVAPALTRVRGNSAD